MGWRKGRGRRRGSGRGKVGYMGTRGSQKGQGLGFRGKGLINGSGKPVDLLYTRGPGCIDSGVAPVAHGVKFHGNLFTLQPLHAFQDESDAFGFPGDPFDQSEIGFVFFNRPAGVGLFQTPGQIEPGFGIVRA